MPFARPLCGRGPLATALLLAAIALPLHDAAAQAPDLCAGHFTGTITLPPGPLDFDVDFERTADGACRGDISIPAQNATNLPLGAIRISGDSVAFTIDGVPGSPTFRGVRESGGTRVAGSFAQGGGSFPFTMATSESAAERARGALAGFELWADSLLAQWQLVGMGIGIVVDGEVVYARGHGLRDREQQLPVTANTIFAIGSSSKAFTTFAMGRLVDQGRLQWDVPVRQYLPWFAMHDPVVTERLTPRDLVTHRSGLPRHDLVWYNNNDVTREQLVRRVRHLPLSRDLRQEFQYNNLMFLTAGYLVGELSGSRWEEGIQREVLTPLGMGRTNFSVAQSAADRDHSEPYTVREDSIVRMPFRDISLVGPAGSINSTITDMAEWVRLHLNDGVRNDSTIIARATLRDMYSPYTPISGLGGESESGPTSYGLGWFVTTWRGHYHVHHGGNIDGFSALVSLFPNDNIGIVVLANQNESAVPGLVARHAADRLLGAKPRDWNTEALARAKAGQATNDEAIAGAAKLRVPDTRPSRPLAQFVGAYADSGYGTLTISQQRDTLMLEFNGISAPLQHWHYDTFKALRNPADPALEGTQVTFQSNTAGRVHGVQWRTDPLVPETLFLRQPDVRLTDASYLARFAGHFVKGTVDITISMSGSRLMFTQGPLSSPLTPLDDVRWVVDAAPTVELEFVTDGAGGITHLRAIQGGTALDLPKVP